MYSQLVMVQSNSSGRSLICGWEWHWQADKRLESGRRSDDLTIEAFLILVYF